MTAAAEKPTPNFATDWIDSIPLLNGLTQDEACSLLGINIIIILVIRHVSLLTLTDYIIIKRIALILYACIHEYMCMYLNACGVCVYVYVPICVCVCVCMYFSHTYMLCIYTMDGNKFFKEQNHIKENPFKFVSRARHSE